MANTTNLDLVPLDGTGKLKNFPTPYNGNLDKIDAAFGTNFIKIGSQSYESANQYDMYSITDTNDEDIWVIAVLPTTLNVYATNVTNNGSVYEKAFRAYNYDGTKHTNSLAIKYLYIERSLQQ